MAHIIYKHLSADGALNVCACFGAKMRGFDLYIGVNLSFETGIKSNTHTTITTRQKIYEITFTPRARTQNFQDFDERGLVFFGIFCFVGCLV